MFHFRNDYYGGHWASFSLDALQRLPETDHIPLTEKETGSDQFKYLGNNLFGIENFSFQWNIPK